MNFISTEDAPAPVPIHRNGPLESDYRQFTQDPFAGRRTSDTSHPVSYQVSNKMHLLLNDCDFFNVN